MSACRPNSAYAAITGQYPGWDTPQTTIYSQQFTNTNTVWLEIIHEIRLGMACMEVFGQKLRPSSYGVFKQRWEFPLQAIIAETRFELSDSALGIVHPSVEIARSQIHLRADDGGSILL